MHFLSAGLRSFSWFALLICATTAARAANPLETAVAATAYVTVPGHGVGTAFCYDKQGLFLTNAHVVGFRPAGSDVTLVLNSGEGAGERTVTARLLHANHTRDLAVLKVDGQKDLPFIPLTPDVGTLKLGDDIQVLGFPLGPLPAGGETPSVSLNKGGVSSLRKVEGQLMNIQIDAPLNPGNSGGPLLDKEGRAVGVVASRLGGEVQNIGFAIAANQVREFLKEPGMALNGPLVGWSDRSAPHRFSVKLFTEHGAVRPNEVELIARVEGQTPVVSRVAVPHAGDSVEVQLATHPAGDPTMKVRVGAKMSSQGGRVETIPDGVLVERLGLKLSDISRLSSDPNDQLTLHRRTGAAVRVEKKDLALAEKDAARLLPGLWDQATFHVDDATAGSFVFEVRGLRDGKEISFLQCPTVLTGRPMFVNHPGDNMDFTQGDPRSRLRVALAGEGVFEVSLQAPTEQRANNDAGSGPVMGAIWMSYDLGSAPGYYSLCGPFVLVDDALVHLFYDPRRPLPPRITAKSPIRRFISSALPVNLAKGKWTCHAHRDWAAGSPNAPVHEGEITTREADGILSVRFDTPKHQSAIYRLEFEKERKR